MDKSELWTYKNVQGRGRTTHTHTHTHIYIQVIDVLTVSLVAYTPMYSLKTQSTYSHIYTPHAPHSTYKQHVYMFPMVTGDRMHTYTVHTVRVHSLFVWVCFNSEQILFLLMTGLYSVV